MNELTTLLLTAAVLGVALTLGVALLHWTRPRRQRLQRHREQALEAASAKERRRNRACRTMDRATLVEHVAEFGPSTLERSILAGIDTAVLRELCGNIHDSCERARLGILAGEQSGDRVIDIRAEHDDVSRRMGLQPRQVALTSPSWAVRMAGEQAGNWHVYRIRFADGRAYVGMTSKAVAERVAQHLCGEGSPAVRQLRDAGVAYRIEVLASVRTERVARRIENREISKLPRPLNRAGPVRPPGDFYFGCRHDPKSPEDCTVLRPDGAVLQLAPNLAQRYHSPTGFAWGYRGRGPAQLALALLLDHTGGNQVTAHRHYQRFTADHVSRWDSETWTISPAEIASWLSTAAPMPAGSRFLPGVPTPPEPQADDPLRIPRE